MDSEAFVQLALDNLSCSQKELAARVGVSPTQISKWKKGEHMSLEMQMKFREIAKIGDSDPNFVVWAGSIVEAEKWERLIHFLAQLAQESAETGYNTSPLMEDEGSLCWKTFYVLREMGIYIPKKFPEDLDVDYEDPDIEDIGVLIEANPYSALIYEIYNSLNDVYGFYAAYVSELILDEELNLLDTSACNIEPSLMSLAACKLECEQEFAPDFKKFRHRVTNEFEEWLTIVKDKAFRAGVPLKAELLDLVHQSADELGHEAEAESLGMNSSRIHPDVYMNELLVGMRVIHQVLPAIMKKLGIDEEFKLNEKELRIG